MIKHYNNEINVEDKNKIILIVGERPGTVKKYCPRSGNYIAFDSESKNKTALFVNRVIKQTKNIILTNAINYSLDKEKITEELKNKGIEELDKLIKEIKPIKIITLGAIARDSIKKLNIKDYISLRHPSYVIKFDIGKEDYEKQLIEAITI
jgi:hypothetical protein